MIRFEADGTPIVHFHVVGGNTSRPARAEVEMPLADYLALAKIATTLEEFRCLFFEHSQKPAKETAVAAGAV